MIDIQTFMLALGIGNISFALLMVAYIRDTEPSPGLRIWTWARLIAGATQLMAFARPQLGVPVLVLLEPVGWIAGLALEVAAYCTFFGFRNWQRIVYPLAGLALLVACTAPLAGASYSELMLLISFLFALCAISTAYVLLHPALKNPSLLQRIIGVNDAVFGLAIVVWAAGAVERGQLDLFELGATQFTAYISGYALMIVNGFGFLLMCKQRNDAAMKRLASTDDLTGLLNRREFLARADAARMLALRQRQPIALLMLDIDHFKQLNDRFGHATGDEALLLFARTTDGILREHDILGRMGGEEFALALPGTDLAGAMQAAERLRQATMEIRLLTCGNHYTMTVSIGLVVIESNEDLPAALARADRGLYAAKRNGRNRIEEGGAVRRAA
ncbi:GGDEF domain-containing protein [Massilia sp.]|uniref:GGDEF domain-containing protein n=1 Tax=Massilia sp. TaxID=1882437 RepID=UPI0028A5830D|nr:GGDEF domain-containing protein [Massilia sp.]